MGNIAWPSTLAFKTNRGIIHNGVINCPKTGYAQRSYCNGCTRYVSKDLFLYLFSNTQNQKGDKLTNMMLPMAEGEQWKALRAAMSPTFSTGKLKLVRAFFHLSNSTMWSTQRDSPIPVAVLFMINSVLWNSLLSRLTVLASVDPGIPLFPKKARILYFADRFKSHLKSCRKFRYSDFLKISDTWI